MLPVVGGAAVSDPLHERAIRRSADRKSTRLNSSHLVISYAVFFFRKKTRLNSSHLVISYAVFCLKKKKSLCHTYQRRIADRPSRTARPHIQSLPSSRRLTEPTHSD